MAINACPHYPPPNAGVTYLCRGCGSELTNPLHPAAAAEGRLHSSGNPVMKKAPGNNARPV